MRLILAASCAAVLLVGACSSGQEPDTSSDFAALLDEHFERNLSLNPVYATGIGESQFNDQYANSIGPEHRAAIHELNVEFLSRLVEIDRNELGAQDQLSYDMFKLRREMSLAGEQFPSHLAPMNQFRSATSSFVRLGSGSGIHPFETVQDYDDFLSRVDGFVVYIDQSIANMKEGAQQGITQPKVLMQKFAPQIKSQLVDSAEDSGFYTPIQNMPEAFSETERERLTLAYKIGMLKIREIRADAESRLGDNFDVRAFHTEVLMDGPMPLSMLQNKMDGWVSAQL